MEERNPYTSMLDTMDQRAKLTYDADGMKIYLGKVLSSAPLSVSVAGTIQSADHFYINEALCKDHKEKVKLDGTFNGLSMACACTGGYNSPEITGNMQAEAEEIVLEPVLRAGDLVVCLSADDQMFYLICRVVNAA